MWPCGTLNVGLRCDKPNTKLMFGLLEIRRLLLAPLPFSTFVLEMAEARDMDQLNRGLLESRLAGRRVAPGLPFGKTAPESSIVVTVRPSKGHSIPGGLDHCSHCFSDEAVN